MSVTNAEDLPRISEAEIERETAGTFLGEARVRGQLRIGAFWPRGEVPDADEPVSVDVPVLLLSGSHDPVTPPRWGAEAASHLPNSLHVVVAGCHGVAGKPQVAKFVARFLERGSVEGLDPKSWRRCGWRASACPGRPKARARAAGRRKLHIARGSRLSSAVSSRRLRPCRIDPP